MTPDIWIAEAKRQVKYNEETIRSMYEEIEHNNSLPDYMILNGPGWASHAAISRLIVQNNFLLVGIEHMQSLLKLRNLL